MKPQIFEVENGDETDWVVALDKESVIKLLKEEMDYEEEETYPIKILNDNELEEKFVYHVEEDGFTVKDENKVSFKKSLEEIISNKEELPVYLCGTIFSQGL